MTNSSVAYFADDTKIFRRVDSITDAMLLQEDLNNLESWSNSCGLVFNEEKCKSLSITRCNEPIIYPYKIKGKQLTSSPTEKDLGIWIASDLTWSKQVLNRCARANKLLGYVKRCSGEISNVRVRRSLYLHVFGSLGLWLLEPGLVTSDCHLNACNVWNAFKGGHKVHFESSIPLQRDLSGTTCPFTSLTAIVLA